MILKCAGPLTPELHALGSIDLPAFLLDADCPAIIDAGMTCMGSLYVQELRKVLNGRPPAYFLLTHTHYDHCGAVAQLKRAFPDMQVCCAEAGEQILQRPRAIATIRELNRAGALYIDSLYGSETATPEFEVFPVDRTFADGETIQLGKEMSLTAIATPGHTRDSMSYYVPEKKMLFTGEAVGIMEAGGYIYSEWLASYDDYIRSMEKLATLEVETLCIGHGLVLTGTDAADYLPRSMEYCLSFRRLIETTLEETGDDVEETKRRIKQTEYDPLPGPKQPEFAYLINLEAKIRAIQILMAS